MPSATMNRFDGPLISLDSGRIAVPLPPGATGRPLARNSPEGVFRNEGRPGT